MRRAIGAYAAVAVVATLTACTASSTAGSPPTSSASVSSSVMSSGPQSIPVTSSPVQSPSQSEQQSTTHSTSTPSAAALPLRYPTGDAMQVVTVVAASHSSTSATLQAWRRVGSGWARVGSAVHAWLGSGGIGHASEHSTATPAGSFTLTQAFGRYADPGTALPYRRTTPADWWISQSGRLYNSEQHCVASCPFTQGEPNEHLYYATPFYEYAVVIDYNRHPVVQGAGSAFFLHVTVGAPTQGCVSIARAQLVRILRWLSPAAHPRILMGVG